MKFFKNNFLNSGYDLDFRVISFLFILLPFTLITGPFLPDLFLSVIALYFLVISIHKKLLNYYKNKVVYIFSFFYFYLLIRGLLSNYPYDSLINYNGPLFYFRYLFFVLGIKYILDTNAYLIKIFSITLLITLIFVIVDGYLQWIIGTNIFGFTSTNNRLSGIFKDEQILGHFLSHVIPLLIGLLIYVYGINKKNVFLLISLLVISEILIFITNDRAGFLKIFQFSLLLILLSNHFKFFRLISFIISIIVIALILQNSPASKQRYSVTVHEVSSTYLPYMPWTYHHEKHFKLALKMFKDNPIFGQGPQIFRTLCDVPDPREGCTNHPHNYYFQTLSELGLIGFFFLLIGFYYLSLILLKQFYNLWFNKKNKLLILPDHLVAMYSLALILFWPLIPHQSFYNNWLNVYVFLPFGFLLFFHSKKK